MELCFQWVNKCKFKFKLVIITGKCSCLHRCILVMVNRFDQIFNTTPQFYIITPKIHNNYVMPISLDFETKALHKIVGLVSLPNSYNGHVE